MEIQLLSSDSIKIKGKNASVVFDPNGKVEAEIVIVTKPSEKIDSVKVPGMRLLISGPGEYEAGGISISGKKQNDKVIYIFQESAKIIYADSEVSENLPDDEDFDAVIVHITGKFSDEVLSSVNAKTIILYGNLSTATIKTENKEKTNKVNLKKSSDAHGKTFIFE